MLSVAEGMYPSDVASSASGVPVQVFVKDVLRVGRYEHPAAGWEMEVDEPMLDRLVETYAAMRANGVDVEVTKDHSNEADAVVGYCRGLFRVGGTLYARCEIRGAAALELVSRVRNVSVEIADNYRDGKGNEYGVALFRVSVVQQPIMPGQGEFVRAASHGSGSLLIMRWASISRPGGAARGRWLSRTGGDAMDTKKLLGAVGVLLAACGAPSGEEVTEANAEARLSEWAGKVKQQRDDSQKRLSSLEAEVASLRAASQKAPSPEQLEAMEERAEALGETLDGLTGGTLELSQQTVQGLKLALLGEPGKRPVAMLSRGANAAPPVARAFVDAIRKAAKAPGAGTGKPTTGVQKLSHGAAAGGDAPVLPSEDDVRKAIDQGLALIGHAPRK